MKTRELLANIGNIKLITEHFFVDDHPTKMSKTNYHCDGDENFTVTEFEAISSAFFYIYRNLKTRQWQVKTNNTVFLKIDPEVFPNIVLVDASPHIIPSGKKRALETQERNVHSFLKTKKFIISPQKFNMPRDFNKQITYKPFLQNGWVYKNMPKNFDKSRNLLLDQNFKVWEI